VVKRLRFFPDDMADPLWDADSGGMVDLDYLPLRDDTRKALRSWRDQWVVLVDRSIWAQAFAQGMSDRTPDPVSREEWTRAERDGRELFERVKADLGADWSVEWDVLVPD
jgi:hypothetical protein